MNSELRQKKEGKVFEKVEGRSEVSKHRKMKFERLKGGIIERSMEGMTGGWKERQKDSKGYSRSEIAKVGKKEKQLEVWKEAQKYRIGKSNDNGRLEIR